MDLTMSRSGSWGLGGLTPTKNKRTEESSRDCCGVRRIEDLFGAFGMKNGREGLACGLCTEMGVHYWGSWIGCMPEALPEAVEGKNLYYNHKRYLN